MISNKVDAKCSAGNLVSLLKMFLLQFKSHKPRMSFQVAEKFIESFSHFLLANGLRQSVNVRFRLPIKSICTHRSIKMRHRGSSGFHSLGLYRFSIDWHLKFH